MSTPATTGAGTRIERIALDMLVPSPNNPRKHFDEAKLKELAESISSPSGQLVPVLVRVSLNSKYYEILDGERRFRAAKLAKLTGLDCKVVDVDDAQALEITVIANLQREDITPLEEANGVASLLAAGRPVEEISKDLGKSVAWVYLRAKLVDLSPAWRKAVDDPRSRVHGWSAGALELIAPFPVERQDEMLEHWQITSARSVKDLAHIIDQEFLRSLKAAPWSLDDDKLVAKAGACRACPKRTSCQQELFSVSKDDRCTDGACWQAKDKAFIAKRAVELAEKHPTLVKFDKTSYHSSEKGIVGYGQVVAAKKGDPKAKPALIIDGAGKGQLTYVKPASSDGSSGANGRPTGPVPVKDRLEQRLRARREIEVQIVHHLLEDFCDLPEGVADEIGAEAFKKFGQAKRPTRPALMALAINFGVGDNGDYHSLSGTWKGVLAHIALDTAKLDEELWIVVRASIVEHGLQGDDQIDTICELCQLDAKAIRTAVMTIRPLPRTLAATFNEDGSPKKGLTAAAEKKPARAKPVTKPKAKTSSKPKVKAAKTVKAKVKKKAGAA